MDGFPDRDVPGIEVSGSGLSGGAEEATCAGAIKPVAIETKAISLPLASAKAITGIKSMMLPAMAWDVAPASRMIRLPAKYFRRTRRQSDSADWRLRKSSDS